MRLIKFLLLALLATEAHAAPGVQYNAAQGFTKAECRAALKVFDGVKVPKLAFLWRTFDREGGCVEEFLRRFKDRPHVLEIHFSNETCRRAGRFCENVEICPKLRSRNYTRAIERGNSYVLGKIRRRAWNIFQFIIRETYPTTEILLTTGLEDDYSTKAHRVVNSILKKTLPVNVAIGRNPNASDARGVDLSGARFIELHPIGSKFRGYPCVFSNDGLDINFDRRSGNASHGISLPDLSRAIRENGIDCSHSFLWWGEPQGVGAEFTRPSWRDFRLDIEDIFRVNRFLRRNQ